MQVCSNVNFHLGSFLVVFGTENFDLDVYSQNKWYPKPVMRDRRSMAHQFAAEAI
jgi:hypothetical protein